MSNLQHRQTKIQDKRKQTPWREFVMEIASRQPLSLNRKDKLITRYAQRRANIVHHNNFESMRDGLVDNFVFNENDIFFEQLQNLFFSIPKSNLLFFGTNENCDYADVAFNAKNSYLSYHTTIDVENILYSISVKNSCSNIISSICINSSNNVFESRGVFRSFNVFYSSSVLDSNNIWYSSGLVACTECLYCNKLQNSSYCIDNVQYSKENYFAKKGQLLSSQDASKKNQFIPNNIGSESCEGVGIIDSYNISNGFFATAMKDGHNVILASSNDTIENVYDVFGGCGKPGEGGYYATHSCGGCDDVYCSSSMAFCNNCYYSFHLESCSFCLGCIGLKNKSYCILNKQYSKEEWYQKVDEIFSQMDKTSSNSPLSRGGSQLGEFFPATMNPFYFNDTAAYLIDPSFTKEEVVARGYLRRDEAIKVDIPEDAQVVASSELASFEGFDDQGNRTINADILKCVIQDDQGNYYRIIPMEYKFLMKHGLPLPRKHWLERMKENFRID